MPPREPALSCPSDTLPAPAARPLCIQAWAEGDRNNYGDHWWRPCRVAPRAPGAQPQDRNPVGQSAECPLSVCFSRAQGPVAQPLLSGF